MLYTCMVLMTIMHSAIYDLNLLFQRKLYPTYILGGSDKNIRIIDLGAGTSYVVTELRKRTWFHQYRWLRFVPGNVEQSKGEKRLS